MSGGACSCWAGPVTLHAGHCCIKELPDTVDVIDYADRWNLPCGHGDDARAKWEAYQP